MAATNKASLPVPVACYYHTILFLCATSPSSEERSVKQFVSDKGHRAWSQSPPTPLLPPPLAVAVLGRLLACVAWGRLGRGRWVSRRLHTMEFTHITGGGGEGGWNERFCTPVIFVPRANSPLAPAYGKFSRWFFEEVTQFHILGSIIIYQLMANFFIFKEYFSSLNISYH